jgi:hypothetical protein
MRRTLQRLRATLTGTQSVPLIPILFSLVAALVLPVGGPWGIGVSPDSATYIGVAHSLMSGYGLKVPFGSANGPPLAPMTVFPPLFPVLLGLLGIIGTDPLHGATWINGSLFAANTLMVALVLRKCGGSTWIQALGSLFILTSVDMLIIHSMVWTEPLFLFSSLLGIFLLAAYIEEGRYPLLLASSTVIAGASLVRYAGVVWALAGSIGIVLFSEGTRSRRMRDAAAFAGLSVLPMAAWVVRNVYVTGNAAGRNIAFHPITSAAMGEAVATLSAWLLPGEVPVVLGRLTRVLEVSVVVLTAMSLFRGKVQLTRDGSSQPHPSKIPPLLFIFVVCYAALLLVSISFVDLQTPLDSRILSPVFVSGLIVTLCLACRVSSSGGRMGALKAVGVLLAITLACAYCVSAANWIGKTRREGLGFSAKRWRGLEILRRSEEVARNVRVYSNGPDALYVLSRRVAFRIPAKTDPTSGLENERYESEMAKMERDLEQGAVIIYLSEISWRWYLPPENELKAVLPLRIRAASAGGTIYVGRH